MSSKSILILGIVLEFFIIVIAIHNYLINEKIYNSSTPIKDITPIEINETKNKVKKETKKITTTKNKSKENTLNEELKNFKRYKDYYIIEMRLSQKELDEILKKISEEEKKKEALKKEEKKTQDEQKNNEKDNFLEEDALKSITINTNDKIENKYNGIINLSSYFDDNKKIIIKIFQYNTTVSNYLKKIKDLLVDNGIDIDDIGVIYKKDNKHKNEIKVLLVKKDAL